MKKTMKTCVVFGFALSLLMPAQMWAESSVAAPGPNAVEQARPVKGHVVDETGEPLIGVTVRVLGTNGGVVTDINGDFSVNAAPGQQLQFSYAGYKTVTMQAGQGAMNLTMEPDVLGLDDVVVIGYGTQKKRDLTGAVTSMKNADGTVTFRDDGADIYDFNSVTVGAELFGDTLVAHVEFSDPTRSSFVMGTLTFTVSNAFADINYLKYDFRGNVKPVREVEELLPCGSNASCEQCPPDMDCGGIAR